MARVLSFLALVYLARTLGVEAYGTFEFALSLMLYLTLAADGGLELWATREAARVRDLGSLAATVVGLRLVLSVGALIALVVAFRFLPEFRGLRAVMLVLGAGLVLQAVNLKWAFLGRERMRTVARATVAGKLLFAAGIVLFVHSPDGLVIAAVLHVTGIAVTTLFFGIRFVVDDAARGWRASLSGARSVLREAVPLGASQALGLLSYNFDTLFLGFLRGAGSVGIYNAAYKPVVAVLAIPLTCFSGLFPSLSRFHSEDHELFRRLTGESVQVSAAAAVPVAVGGALLAKHVVELLFGAPYADAAPVLSILAWSAALVVLRSGYRRALQAADEAATDLRCAGAATALNLVLNLALIPAFGLFGAAWATVAAEVVWLGLLVASTRELLPDLRLGALLARPVIAGLGMAGVLVVDLPSHWTVRGLVALFVYAGVLLLIGWRPPAFSYPRHE